MRERLFVVVVREKAVKKKNTRPDEDDKRRILKDCAAIQTANLVKIEKRFLDFRAYTLPLTLLLGPRRLISFCFRSFYLLFLSFPSVNLSSAYSLILLTSCCGVRVVEKGLNAPCRGKGFAYVTDVGEMPCLMVRFASV